MCESPTPATVSQYRRVVLKISGEGFIHPGERGIAMDAVTHIAAQTGRAAQLGAQIAIVLGGGNILRGAQFTAVGGSSIREATAHYMGNAGHVDERVGRAGRAGVAGGSRRVC